MRHDIRVHREVYRLPERTLYAAKVSKILLAMDRGEGLGAFAGKTLDEIQLDNVEMEDVGAASSDPNHEEVVPSTSTVPKQDVSPASPYRGDVQPTQEPKKPIRKQRKGCVKNPWTRPEKEVVERRMQQFIKELRCPGMAACVTVVQQEPVLSKRSWKDVKYCTYNIIQKHKRNMGL